MQNFIRNLFISLFLFIFTLTNYNVILSQDNNIKMDILNLKSPDKFKAKFETTVGNFEVTAERKFSPLAVDRLYQLIKSKYFTDIPLYRVIDNFVVQFGTVDGGLDSAWSKYILLDEPVLKSNEAATIAFARGGKNSRGTQLFINLKNNFKLDTVTYGETLGFPAFAYVSSGMDVVYKFYKGYGDAPRLILDSVSNNVKEFIKNKYPNLDYIKQAYIIKE